MPDLGKFVRRRGRCHEVYFLCFACDSNPAFTRGRERKASPDEVEARCTLLEIGLPFKQEVALGHYWFDFSVPSVRLLIEVDSQTYHSGKRKLRDVSKQFLAESQGWQVIRVRRPDIKGKLVAAVELRAYELYERENRQLTATLDRYGRAGADAGSRGGAGEGGVLAGCLEGL